MSSNPVAARLDGLRLQWMEFSKKPDARVLCWLLESDEYSMVRRTGGGRERRSRRQSCRTSSSRFPRPSCLGSTARDCFREFLEKAEALHAGLEDDSVAKWQPPAPPANGPEGLALWRACTSFVDSYKLPRSLALVLTPSKVDDMAAFRQWLDNAARTALPALPKLRLVVLDDVQAPSMAELARASPERVVAVPAELDMARGATRSQ